MSQGNNMVYLGLCVRYEPPIIGVHYKNKQTDTKKKLLVLHPNSMQAAHQLYLQHPHILKESKIPKEKIAALIQKIQKQLRIGEEDYSGDQQQDQEDQDYDEQYEPENQDQEHQQQEEQRPQKQPNPPEEKKPQQRPKFDFDRDFGRDDGPLNRSL